MPSGCLGIVAGAGLALGDEALSRCGLYLGLDEPRYLTGRGPAGNGWIGVIVRSAISTARQVCGPAGAEKVSTRLAAVTPTVRAATRASHNICFSRLLVLPGLVFRPSSNAHAARNRCPLRALAAPPMPRYRAPALPDFVIRGRLRSRRTQDARRNQVA
jgi:hypothetical protein